MKKSAAEVLLKKYRSYTLGQAVKLVNKEHIYTEPLQRDLENFLSERNWLVHKSIAQNREEWDSGRSRKEILLRIKAVTHRAFRIVTLIEDDLFVFSEANGLDMSKIRTEIEKFHA